MMIDELDVFFACGKKNKRKGKQLKVVEGLTNEFLKN
jgi:hypothetical protein